MKHNPMINAEHYSDPTSGQAIKNIEESETERFSKFIYVIKNIAELSGFEIKNRLTVEDRITGKTWY
jgi:hypothetical protein